MLKKLLLTISEKNQCRNLFLNKDKLKLHAATIFMKKDTPVKMFSFKAEKHLTTISQSSWMNNFRDY